MTAALYSRGSGSLIGGAAAAHWFVAFPGGLGGGCKWGSIAFFNIER